MGLVQTAKGFIPREYLEVRDRVEEAENSRAIATEWSYIGPPSPDCEYGEIVKRSATVEILCTQAIGSEQAAIG